MPTPTVASSFQNLAEASAASPVTWSFATTVGRVVVFKLGTADLSMGGSHGTPSLDGVAMTPVTSVTANNYTDETWWGVASPSGGDSTVTFTVGLTGVPYNLQAWELLDADTTDPIGNTATASGAFGSSHTTSVSSDAANLVLVSGTSADRGNAGTTGSGVSQDQAGSHSGGAQLSSAIGHVAGAATVTAGITYNFSATALVALIEILPSAGSGTAITATSMATSTTSYSLRSRRATAFTATATSSESAALGARRSQSLTVPATTTQTANLAARRAMALTAAGVSTVVVVANVRRVQIATVPALSTVTWAQHARRDVRQASTGISAVSVTLDRITADNAIAVTITALSAMVAQMNARRSLQLAAAASSGVSSEIAARRALLAIFAPQSAVTVDLDGTSAASASTGKYQREHDAAFVDLAASTGFASEHRSVLSDLLDAGG